MLIFIVTILIVGLIIGALGRLIVPGPTPMGLLATALCGIGGAFVGGFIARLIWTAPGSHTLGEFICAVVGAALLVALVSGSRRRRVYY